MNRFNFKNLRRLLGLTLLSFSVIFMTGCKDDNGIKIESGPGALNEIYLTPTVAPAPGTSGIVSSTLPECRNEKEMVLISSYYQAIKTRDLSLISTYLSDSSLATENIFDNFENVTDITIKKIYTVPGTELIDTICYVYYEVSTDQFNSIPSLDELYICTKSSAKYIFNGAISKEEHAKIVAKSSIQAVTDLKDSVNAAFQKALNENEGLADYLSPKDN